MNPTPTPKKSPLGPKSKKDPKIKLNSNVTIEGIIENDSCSSTWGDPKADFEPYPEPKNSPNRTLKSQKRPQKLNQNHKLELKEA